jgi:UDP-2,3-diacylglucosamine pyrophosphatase LpxH
VPNLYTDTLIISDLHLGSDVSRAREALEMLRSQSFRRLILLGDIFCDLNFARLKKQHWHFLSYIRKLSNPKREVEVIWVEGNHDQGLSRVMSHLVGIKVYREYCWEFAGKRHLAIHGHQFDRFGINNAFLSKIGAAIYLHLQKIEPERSRLTRALDRLNTSWLRLSPKVASGALAYAKLRGADRILCGHTHLPMHAERDGISYHNAGCWIHNSATYITVNEEGVEIHDYTQQLDYRDPGEERVAVAAPAAALAGAPGLGARPEYEGVCS